jgi:D-aminopeptidase
MGNDRPRARDIGLTPGTLPPGRLNSITDVRGVRVGQKTLIVGEDIRTGVTAILPHEGNMFQDKVPGAIFVENGFGKLVGSTQVNELGEIETPIMLTNTLCVHRVADALIDYMLEMPENANVKSINPLVGETNDGFLNNIRKKTIGRDEVFYALANTTDGIIEEGCVGAGTGTRALGFKGGIGTSSRHLSGDLGNYSVGVIVQTNFGGVLTINGAPVGKELAEIAHSKKNEDAPQKIEQRNVGDIQKLCSVMVVIATDAPVGFRNLRRVAVRSALGLGRTGFTSQNHSGDYFTAFTIAEESRTGSCESKVNRKKSVEEEKLTNDAMDPLFLGAIEATEEAVYNSLFKATTMNGYENHVTEALPIEATAEILRKHKAI